jgi:hypothetical protein
MGHVSRPDRSLKSLVLIVLTGGLRALREAHMFVVTMFRGGMTYVYGPFPTREAGVNWAVTNSNGCMFETVRLYEPMEL